MTDGSNRRAVGALLALLLVLVATPLLGGAGAQESTRAERERVRREKAAVAAEVDALEATNAEVQSALDRLQANVSAQSALLQDAQRAADQAAHDVEVARAEEQAKVAEIETIKASLQELAIEAYIQPPSVDALAVLRSESITDAATRRALLDFQASRDQDLVDQLRAARQDLERRRQAAEAAAVRAEEEKQKVGARLDELEQAEAQQAEFAFTVDARLDAKLAESASLAVLDTELSNRLAREEAELAARLRAEADARAASARRAASSAPRAVITPPNIVGSGEIVSVRGIQVHRNIADNLAALLSAADADGIVLGGGGYRDSSAQIAVRRSNCGTSDYAVYQMPPSQCSPPTARPGTSMHERGLAIDFTYNGRVISSRSSPAFQWLSSKASSYGLYNLPSEPWHWSTTGQ